MVYLLNIAIFHGNEKLPPDLPLLQLEAEIFCQKDGTFNAAALVVRL
jgi:hypothetical protein